MNMGAARARTRAVAMLTVWARVRVLVKLSVEDGDNNGENVRVGSVDEWEGTRVHEGAVVRDREGVVQILIKRNGKNKLEQTTGEEAQCRGNK